MANADVGERMKALRRNALILVSVIGVATSVVLVVVFSGGPGPAGAPPHDITIVSPKVAPYFSPDNLTAHLANGGSVTVPWYNADVNIHSVVSDTGLFQSPMIAPGNTWSYTFNATGTYGYHCSPYPWMTGTISVVST